MFCIYCGEQNPDIARYCRTCGRGAPPVVKASEPTSSPAPAAQQVISVYGEGAPSATQQPKGQLPYAWGKFHGWALIVGAAVSFLIGLTGIGDPVMMPRAEANGYLLWPLVAIPTAIGILKRKRWIVPVAYGHVALAAIVTVLILNYQDNPLGLSAQQDAFDGLVGPVFAPWAATTAGIGVFMFWQTVIWAVSAYYYQKRRHEFAS